MKKAQFWENVEVLGLGVPSRTSGTVGRTSGTFGRFFFTDEQIMTLLIESLNRLCD